MKFPFTLKTRYKRLFYALLILLGTGVALQLALNLAVKHFLENNPTVRSYFAYKKASANILLRQIEVSDLRTLRPLPVKNTAVSLHSTTITLSGISLWDLLVQKKINARTLVITAPVVSYTKKEAEAPAAQTDPDPEKAPDLHLSIARFRLSNGKISATATKKSGTLLQADNIDLTLNKLHLAQEKSGKLNVSFEKHSLKLQNFSYMLNDYDVFRLKKLTAAPGLITLTAAGIHTRYSREELSRVTPVERDHVALTIPKIELFGLNKELIKKSIVQLDSISIKRPALKMYRDKLLPDDTSYKPLYTERLRAMALGLDIANIRIDSGYISYTERVQEKVKPEAIFFDNLQARVSHLNNRSGKAFTINTHSQLMGEAPFQVTWIFKDPAQNDDFNTRGKLYDFNPTALNPFLRTNLSATMEGYVDELYFTIAGNKQLATGDLKMKYEDFKVNVLQNDLQGINKIITSVVDIFTKSGSEADADGYRYGSMQEEPDLTKSFFNYQWNTVKSGLINTVTGDGKKE